MGAVDWIGAIVAAVAGGAGVMHVAMKEFSSDNEADGTDGRRD